MTSGCKTAEWSTGYHDGYYTKIIKVGNATVEINRPILEPSEQARMENQVKEALVGFGRRINHERQLHAQ